MTPRHRGLRRVLPTYREMRRIVRQGQALMGALVAAGLVLALTLAVVAAAGWGGPSFEMSKLTRADLRDAGRADRS
jgi:hypothetical protein